MTGAYVRVNRNGKWEIEEFDQLTDEEMEEFVKRHPDEGWVWARFFAKFIRDRCLPAEDEIDQQQENHNA